jgi:hypothetical protein
VEPSGCSVPAFQALERKEKTRKDGRTTPYSGSVSRSTNASQSLLVKERILARANFD